jgi:hypothetical protein
MHSEINGQLWYLLRAVNHEREVLESVVAAKVRDTSGVEGSQAHHEVIWLTTERSAPTTFISRRGGKRLPIAGRSLDGQQSRRVRNSRFGDENAEDAAKVQLSTSSDLDRFQSGRRLVTRQASR